MLNLFLSQYIVSKHVNFKANHGQETHFAFFMNIIYIQNYIQNFFNAVYNKYLSVKRKHIFEKKCTEFCYRMIQILEENKLYYPTFAFTNNIDLSLL